MSQRSAAAILLMAATACGTDLPPAGDRGETWTLEPLHRIGNEADPRTALTHLADAATGPDGHLYVTQWQVPEVTVFDSAGRFIRAIGRGGPGPGEFTSPGVLGWRGDTLWVSDGRSGRLVLYSPDGEHIRDIGFVIPPRGDGGRALVPLRPLADGSVLAGNGGGPPISQVLRGQLNATPPVRAAAEGRVENEIVELPLRAADYIRVNLPGGGGLVGGHPLPSAPLWTLTEAGDRVIVLEREGPEADSASFRITAIGLGGDTVWSRDYPYPATALTESWKAGWLGEQAEGVASYRAELTQAAIERAFRESVTFPEYFPPVTELVAGSDGTLWIRREEVDSAVTWQVLSSSGEALAEVAMPTEWDLLDASRGRVWVATRDELDVPYLLRLRVEGSRVDFPDEP